MIMQWTIKKFGKHKSTKAALTITELRKITNEIYNVKQFKRRISIESSFDVYFFVLFYSALSYHWNAFEQRKIKYHQVAKR